MIQIGLTDLDTLFSLKVSVPWRWFKGPNNLWRWLPKNGHVELETVAKNEGDVVKFLGFHVRRNYEREKISRTFGLDMSDFSNILAFLIYYVPRSDLLCLQLQVGAHSQNATECAFQWMSDLSDMDFVLQKQQKVYVFNFTGFLLPRDFNST